MDRPVPSIPSRHQIYGQTMYFLFGPKNGQRLSYHRLVRALLTAIGSRWRRVSIEMQKQSCLCWAFIATRIPHSLQTTHIYGVLFQLLPITHSHTRATVFAPI